MPDIETNDRLTKAEAGVLELLAEGYTNQAVADKLYVTKGTVERYVHILLQKINVPDGMSRRVWIALHAREFRDKKYLVSE